MEKVTNKYDCINYGGTWNNRFINFDNIGNSILTLFIMSTNEGWVEIMDYAVDSAGVGMQPKRGNHAGYQIIFIIYMIFGSLFITNLFIYVVINTFNTQKDKIDKNFSLTDF